METFCTNFLGSDRLAVILIFNLLRSPLTNLAKVFTGGLAANLGPPPPKKLSFEWILVAFFFTDVFQTPPPQSNISSENGFTDQQKIMVQRSSDNSTQTIRQ